MLALGPCLASSPSASSPPTPASAARLLTSRTEAHRTARARTTTFEYQSGTNLLTATVDPLSRRKEMVYDARGNVTTLRTLAGTPSQMTQTFTYTSDWNLLSTATLGKITRYFYDTRGRLIEVRDALNCSRRSISDPPWGCGQIVGLVIDPARCHWNHAA
jgi:YD repeat-containing protein